MSKTIDAAACCWVLGLSVANLAVAMLSLAVLEPDRMIFPEVFFLLNLGRERGSQKTSVRQGSSLVNDLDL